MNYFTLTYILSLQGRGYKRENCYKMLVDAALNVSEKKQILDMKVKIVDKKDNLYNIITKEVEWH